MELWRCPLFHFIRLSLLVLLLEIITTFSTVTNKHTHTRFISQEQRFTSRMHTDEDDGKLGTCEIKRPGTELALRI